MEVDRRAAEDPGQRPTVLTGRALAFAAGLLTGLAGSLLARRVDVVEVTGRSMAPTLLAGDRLVVESFTLARRPARRGEIVLAPDPRQPGRELVKRVGRVVAGGLELAGDAPDASTDSRAFGPVPAGRVRWRVALRCWPPARVRRF